MSQSGKYTMIGERLCLDFVNTISWRGSEDSRKRREWFTSYEKLVDWSLEAGIITKEQSRNLLEEAERRQSDAKQALEQAVRLREAFYAILRAVQNGDSSPVEVLADFNESMRNSYQNIKLVPADDHYMLRFDHPEHALDAMLPPIVQSVVDLLTSEPDLKRVKQCEGDACGWLFYDTSRNRSRRWCSMTDCGNRAKAQRFYKNKKETGKRSGS